MTVIFGPFTAATETSELFTLAFSMAFFTSSAKKIRKKLQLWQVGRWNLIPFVSFHQCRHDDKSTIFSGVWVKFDVFWGNLKIFRNCEFEVWFNVQKCRPQPAPEQKVPPLYRPGHWIWKITNLEALRKKNRTPEKELCSENLRDKFLLVHILHHFIVFSYFHITFLCLSSWESGWLLLSIEHINVLDWSPSATHLCFAFLRNKTSPLSNQANGIFQRQDLGSLRDTWISCGKSVETHFVSWWNDLKEMRMLIFDQGGKDWRLQERCLWICYCIKS